MAARGTARVCLLDKFLICSKKSADEPLLDIKEKALPQVCIYVSVCVCMCVYVHVCVSEKRKMEKVL